MTDSTSVDGFGHSVNGSGTPVTSAVERDPVDEIGSFEESTGQSAFAVVNEPIMIDDGDDNSEVDDLEVDNGGWGNDVAADVDADEYEAKYDDVTQSNGSTANGALSVIIPTARHTTNRHF